MGRKRKKQLEFSKKIMICIAVVDIAVVVFAFAMMWRTFDITPLQYIIPVLGGLTTAGLGFYFSKAKLENKIKLMKANDIKPTRESFDEFTSEYYGGNYNDN